MKETKAREAFEEAGKLRMAEKADFNDSESDKWSEVTKADLDSESEKWSEVTQEELDELAKEVAFNPSMQNVNVQPKAQPKAMPRSIKVQHQYAREVPDWVKKAENSAYLAYAKTPLIGHSARKEAWRWRARRTYAVPVRFPEIESRKDTGCARGTRMILKRIREIAFDEQEAWQKQRKEKGKRMTRLPETVPDKVYTLLEKAFRALKICEEWFSGDMQLKLIREIFYTVAYVEDQFADQLFLRKAANAIGIKGIPVHLFALNQKKLRTRPQVGTTTGATLDQPRKRSRKRSPARHRKSPEAKRPKIMTRMPVDDVEFSQDSIAVRFSCGLRIRKLVTDLQEGKVDPEDVNEFPFMKLLAMKIDDRIISRCNRRLWCLREVQRLERHRDPNYVQHVWLQVQEFPDPVTKDLVRQMLPQKPCSDASEIRFDEHNMKDDVFKELLNS